MAGTPYLVDSNILLRVSASLRWIHFRRFEGGPHSAVASSEHTRALAVAQEQAVLISGFFSAT